MKRNTFGDPRPKGHEEMVEALDERNANPGECNAELSHDDVDGDYKGWSAEVRNNESGDEIFSTLGYENREDLVNDLKAAGITDVADA